MAGIVNEKYTWQPTVKIGDNARQSARVRVWDNDGDSAVNLTTDANGQITEQELFQAIHTITSTSTVSSNQETPHKVRTLYIGDTDLDSPNGKYATVVDEFNKDLGQIASLNTIFLDIDPFVTHTKTAIAAYTGIAFTHASDLLTVTTAHTMLELYEACVEENYDNPQYDTTSVLVTTDGKVFELNYDLVINGVNLTCAGDTIRPTGTFDVTFQGAGNIQTGALTVDGDINWGTATTISNITVTNGAFDFSTAGTYSVTNCDFAEVTNSSGGAVIINAVNSSITTNTGPSITINNSVNISINVKNSAGTNIENARVFIEADSGGPLSAGTEITNNLTNASGNVVDTLNYTSDQPIIGRVRKSSGSPFYKTSTFTGTIGSGGFDLNVILLLDE